MPAVYLPHLYVVEKHHRLDEDKDESTLVNHRLLDSSGLAADYRVPVGRPLQQADPGI